MEFIQIMSLIILLILYVFDVPIFLFYLGKTTYLMSVEHKTTSQIINKELIKFLKKINLTTIPTRTRDQKFYFDYTGYLKWLVREVYFDARDIEKFVDAYYLQQFGKKCIKTTHEWGYEFHGNSRWQLVLCVKRSV